MKQAHLLNLYIILSIFVISLFSLAGCGNTITRKDNEPIPTGFCVDILGTNEPVFSKPFLESLERLEKKHLIRLEIRSCEFAKEYKNALISLAQNNRLVFCGPFFSELIMDVAKINPSTFFVLFQSIPNHSTQEILKLPNLQVILFKKEDQSSLMGQLCYYYSNQAQFWLVTALPSDNPIRILQENMFIKGMQKPSRLKSILEWPLSSDQSQELAAITDRGMDQVFCLTEGAYLPSFLEWSQKLTQDSFYLIMPDKAWSQNQSFPLLGTITKSYPEILERMVKQVQKNAWSKGIHYIGITEQGYEITLPKALWEPSLLEKIRSDVAPISVRTE